MICENQCNPWEKIQYKTKKHREFPDAFIIYFKS